jgi:hypothetical protein
LTLGFFEQGIFVKHGEGFGMRGAAGLAQTQKGFLVKCNSLARKDGLWRVTENDI